MTLIARDLNRNRAVARRFDARARQYDAHAGLQRQVAARLAEHLPARPGPRILEIGCGTGFLTGHLLDAYGDADLLATDLAPAMVAACRERHAERRGARLGFAVMDGETPDCDGKFDLIVSAMALQWFSDPLAGLAQLRAFLNPDGVLCYATLGPESFAEWRDALAREKLPEGVVAMPPLPGVFHEERETVAYETAIDFLAAMRAIGAGEPRAGYRTSTPGALRRALRRLERDSGSRVTWHIVYGQIGARP